MYRNLLTVRNFIGNATRYFASDAAAVLKSTRLPPKKPAGWTMPEKTAYIDGICMEGAKNSTAGFGVFWGEDHANNTYGSVEGAQTSNRAGFVAMIEAVKQVL
ncbi:RNase H domain-containing protein [Ditylenchus destructor]|nr:RNase H domain-containing protein [Ditylenchus destructor]